MTAVRDFYPLIAEPKLGTNLTKLAD